MNHRRNNWHWIRRGCEAVLKEDLCDYVEVHTVQSLEHAISNTMREKHMFATNEAYQRRLEMFQDGLAMLRYPTDIKAEWVVT